MAFEAEYHGSCWYCEQAIEPGQVVEFNSGHTVQHADCDEVARPERPRETCTDCWVLKPCGCGEF